MSSIVHIGNTDEKSARQRDFRRQFAANLNAALDRRGSIPAGYGRVAAVAELFGVSQNTAAIWLKGEGVPELFRLPEIADTLNTTVEQLVVGDHSTGAHVIDERYAVLEMHDDAGQDGHAFYALPETLRELGLPRDARMLRVSSDDMEPFVRTGDLVIYDPRVNRIHANGVFVLQVEGKMIVRRAQRGMRHSVRLICDNNRFGDETLDDADFADSDAGDGRIVVIGYVLARTLIGR
jgi:phage repressor protein C with HTH and peptisase S24 domain